MIWDKWKHLTFVYYRHSLAKVVAFDVTFCYTDVCELEWGMWAQTLLICTNSFNGLYLPSHYEINGAQLIFSMFKIRYLLQKYASFFIFELQHWNPLSSDKYYFFESIIIYSMQKVQHIWHHTILKKCFYCKGHLYRKLYGKIV